MLIPEWQRKLRRNPPLYPCPLEGSGQLLLGLPLLYCRQSSHISIRLRRKNVLDRNEDCRLEKIKRNCWYLIAEMMISSSNKSFSFVRAVKNRRAMERQTTYDAVPRGDCCCIVTKRYLLSFQKRS